MSGLLLGMILMAGLHSIQMATLNDTKNLMENLLRDYNKHVRPVTNQSQDVAIYVQLYVKSIQEFDEVREMFSFVGALGIMWLDVSMQWNPGDYGGLSEITMSYCDVWKPELILSSPSDDVEKLGRRWNKIRYFHTGLAQWLPMNLIKSTCAVNVQYYPFDSQSCVTSFNSLGYNANEVSVVPLIKTIDMTFYQENSLWEITGTSFLTEDQSQLDCTFFLKRKPSFVIINILMPILFLSLLNVLVFLLVPESGERASYCITVLLSIAVFMTIINDMLPRTSQPVPMISFKLMIDMVISSLIVFVTILNLRIYSRDNSDPVPKWLQRLYLTLACVCCRKRTIEPRENTMKTFIPTKADGEQVTQLGMRKRSMKDINVKTVAAMMNEDAEKKKPIQPTNVMAAMTGEIIKRQKITWKKISFMIDWIALVVFTVVSGMSFCVFMGATAVNAT